MRSTTSARLAMCRASVIRISRPLQITRRLFEKFSPSRPADAQDTVAVLPPGGLTCAGIPWPGHVRPIAMCRGCLRWQSAHLDGPRLMPKMQWTGLAVWCQDRIRA